MSFCHCGPNVCTRSAPHERVVPLERDHLAAARLRDVGEALLQLLVELGQRRDLLQLLVVQPLVGLLLVLDVEGPAHVDGVDDAVLRPPLLDELLQGGHVLRVRRRAADDDDHLLGVGAPFELPHRGLDAVLDRFLPVAAALRDDAVEEGGHLLPVEREVGPADDETPRSAAGRPPSRSRRGRGR
jgi:hypothetical protein